MEGLTRRFVLARVFFTFFEIDLFNVMVTATVTVSSDRLYALVYFCIAEMLCCCCNRC